MAPAAKLLSVSCSAKPTMKPTTPRPAIMGVTDTPTWDKATSTPTRNTMVPEIEISISFNSCETD